MLYTELLTGCVKVALYMTFMFIMIKIHTFPLFAIRPMYLSMRQFKRALNDVIMSRRAIRNMNTLYPDATPDELQAADNVCIICRDQMIGGSKKLPCNHIFHAACLRSWFQRQQTCPTCRMDVLRGIPHSQQGGQGAQRQQAPPQGAQGQAGNQQRGAAGAPSQSAAGVGPSNRPGNAQPNFGHGFLQGMQFMPPMYPPGAARGREVPAQYMFMPPPPIPMGMPTLSPFSVPVPPGPEPPAAEELAARERRLRQSLEARVQWLQDIHTLFDAAVAQLNQYSAMMAQGGLQPEVTPAKKKSGKDAARKTSSGKTASNQKTPNNPASPSKTATTPSSKTDTAPASTDQADTAPASTDKTDTGPASTANTAATPSSLDKTAATPSADKAAATPSADKAAVTPSADQTAAAPESPSKTTACPGSPTKPTPNLTSPVKDKPIEITADTPAQPAPNTAPSIDVDKNEVTGGGDAREDAATDSGGADPTLSEMRRRRLEKLSP